MTRKIMLILGCLLLAATAVMGQQEFGLDDDPANSAVVTPLPPYRSAEDPLGIGLPSVTNGYVGPSPSLLLQSLLDSDVLLAGPGVTIGIPPLDWVDSFSVNHSGVGKATNAMRLSFSIDRATGGMPGSDAEHQQVRNQQMGDIFDTSLTFNHPVNYLGWGLSPMPFPTVLPGASGAGTNILYTDESVFGLLAGYTYTVGPTMPCPIIPMGGNHDNLDSYNDKPASLTNAPNFFTLSPAQANRTGYGVTPTEIYVSNPGIGLNTPPQPPWAVPADMGLTTFDDSIDALIVFDEDLTFPARTNRQVNVDYALFSLAPGSVTLDNLIAQGYAVDGSTVFFTKFDGTSAIFAFAPALGVRIPPSMAIDLRYTNVDALEIFVDTITRTKTPKYGIPQ